MSRTHRYTLICFLTAAGFVLGSMAGMDFILQEKESRLLQESGTARIESPVAVWQEPEKIGGEVTDTSTEQEERQLTIEQMEEVIGCRTDAVEEILHEPVTGQISMEEAIASGENWLMEMGFVEEERNSQTLARRASLGLKKNQEESGMSMEPYYSFWTVRFSSQSMYAVLSVNAVTGKVWDAEITLYRDMPGSFSWEKLDLFLELTGIEEDRENFVEINVANTEALLRVKDSHLCAEMKFYDIQVAAADNSGNGSRDSDYKEYRIGEAATGEVVEHKEEKNLDVQRIIRYRLVSLQL